MIYLLVDKNEVTQEWVILKTITYPINVRGLSGVTYSDISNLSLEVRKVEGFWTQSDVYENSGEFMEFDNKTVEYDEDGAVVTNTYHYKLMDLAVIKNELDARIVSYRDELLISGFEFDSHVYDTSYNGRQLIQGFVLESLITTDIDEVTIRLKNDTDVVLSVADLKSVLSAIYAYTEQLYQKERQMRTDLAAAQTYQEARDAATWDGKVL